MLLFATGCGDPDRNTEIAGLTPAVASVTPPDGSTGACSLAVVTATFSEAMNPATINATTFTVSPGVTGIITHDVSNTIFTFTPSSPLAVNTSYTATISTRARNVFGVGLARSFVWSFTTAANACAPPPVVISVTPLTGATGVCSLAVITVTFSEAMNTSSINATAFKVTPGVTGIITHDVTNTIFTFTPSSPLAVNTVYTATLTTAVQDGFGKGLATNFVWSFRTSANGCNPSPTVIAETPANGSAGVCSNTVITATLSEGMNPATINITTFTVTPGVTGIITHDVTNTIFTFTPLQPSGREHRLHRYPYNRS